MENAVHGCEKTENGYIKVKIYEKNKKLCINIANSLCENIVFENHMPVAKNAGHRIGVKSMASVMEKYGGVYGFLPTEKNFVFRRLCNKNKKKCVDFLKKHISFFVLYNICFFKHR